MLNQKIIKNILSLITFSFLYVNASFGSDENKENSPPLTQKRYHCISASALNFDVLTYIFEIAKQDKILLKNLRVACTLFRDMEAKYADANRKRIFYFTLNKKSLPVFKKLPHATVIIRAATLQEDPFFFEKAKNSCLSIISFVLLAPSRREYDKLNYVVSSSNIFKSVFSLTFNFVNFSPLSNLRNLTVQNRIFVKKDFYPIMLLTALTNLDLTGAHFHNFNGINYVTSLHNLERLNLKECAGKKNNFSTLSRLANLKELNVFGSALKEKEIKSILHLTQLRTLNIDGNMEEVDTFEGIENFTRLTGLETLGLDGDIFTSYQTFISSLTSLKSLTIDGEVCDIKKGLGHLFKSKSATM